MANILVLNIGSSSIKYSVFSNGSLLLSRLIEEIGDGPVKTYNQGMKLIIQRLAKENIEIDAIGHRVVHGGDMTSTTLIDKKVLNRLKKCSELAPLHNIPEVKGIESCLKLFDGKGRKHVKQFAVFDTAFHSTLPPKAHTYALPRTLTKKYDIRKYGFHGTSHKYVAHEACRLLNKKVNQTKIITCHLGNGASITAINKGKSIDTSMGFTPLEGLVMGTRSGDIDPVIPLFLMDNELFSTEEMNDILNHKSGLKALCGTSDMRKIMSRKSPDSRLAIEVFCYRILKYIGAYAAVLDGVDLIVFTGGIGENESHIRKKILDNLGYLGVKVDTKKNRTNDFLITTPKSKVEVAVVKTDEALMIAREVSKVL